MRFKEYLEEEWLSSTIEYDIFLNPSQKEKTETIQVSKEDGYGGRIRGLIDKNTKDVYIFPAALLHDKACDKIDKKKTKKYWEHFYPFMGLFYNSKFHFIIFHAEEDEDEDRCKKILKEKGWNPVFGFDGVPDNMFEEYICRHKKKDYEIHKNPSYTEMVKLGKQYEKRDLHKSLRLIIDLNTDDFYAAPIGYLHDDMVKDLGLSLNTLRAIVRLEKGGLWFKYVYDEDGYEEHDELDEIRDLFKKQGLNVDFSNLQLDEQYVGFATGEKISDFKGGHTEIFKNPTKKEMMEVTKMSKPGFPKGTLRFIADFKNENLFIFKVDTFHLDVAHFLVREKELTKKKDMKSILWAVAKYENGYLTFVESDEYWVIPHINEEDYDDSWTKRFFKTSLMEQAYEWYKENRE